MKKENKLVFGIGVNDFGERVNVDGKMIKPYVIWRAMLQRCYSEKKQIKCPTYIGCTVCDEWLSFSTFKKWFDKNYRWDLEEIGLVPCLDKDLIVEGNKIYSPNTCVFLPQSVNKFLANKKKTNTSGTIGVCWDKHANKWRARINDGKLKNLGLFKNIEDAKQAYQHGRALKVLEIQEQMRELGYSEDIIKLVK